MGSPTDQPRTDPLRVSSWRRRTPSEREGTVSGATRAGTETGRATSPATEEVQMLAAIGLGWVGLVIVIALVIAVVVWLLNRA